VEVGVYGFPDCRGEGHGQRVRVDPDQVEVEQGVEVSPESKDLCAIFLLDLPVAHGATPLDGYRG
jgi:hypothetical protein